MVDSDELKLVAALADASGRVAAAAALASRFSAAALQIFVEDPDVDALLPAPGLPQTVTGGPLWRAFLARCRVPGVHVGTVAYPKIDNVVPALACVGSGVAVVFVGVAGERRNVESVVLLLPLLGAALRGEQRARVASGEVVVARAAARDAAALAQSLDSARASLENQAKSLTEANLRAQIAGRAKDEFLAMLGHELRNPLAPIVTALQILRPKGTASREHEILDRQVANLMRLVDDLLDVSRIASGKVELRRTRIEMRGVIGLAVEMASHLMERKHQRLTMVMPDVGIPVEGDEGRLAQVFSNLITNAAKYSDARTRIVISAERIGDKAVVRVRDEGYGIEPEMLEAIFERFTQQTQPVDRSMGGLGLGLAIVKNIVSLHGGTVRAFSEGRGKGSELVVELPICSAPPELVSRDGRTTRLGESSENARQGAALRVLVVDDNEDAAEMLSEALTELGYSVRSAADGPSALVVAAAFRPHVALLDIGLPVMDGYEVGRRLRTADGQAQLRLVALTGYGQASDKARSREAGFDAHLVKPVDLAMVRRLLEELEPAELQDAAAHLRDESA